MKALFNRKTTVIIAIAVLIAIIAIVSVNVFESAGPVTAFANAVSGPVKSLATSVVRTFESIYSSIYRYDDLQTNYEIAIGDRVAAQRAFYESEELLRDNNRLRALLGFRERHDGLEFEEAKVGDWSSNNFSSSFTINKGYANSDKIIARGNGVVTEYGVLIGQISEVGATTSTVISVLDTTFSAGAYISDGEDSVTVKGEFTLMSDGMLMLDFFNEDMVVLPGDSVITSGVGQVLPLGLVIGEVTEVLRHGTGVGRYAIVKPTRVIDKTIMDVYVITSFNKSD